MTSGLDLKLQRVRRRIKAKHLADAMGVSSARISIIEGQAAVTDDAAERYLTALQTLTTIPTPSEPASAA